MKNIPFSDLNEPIFIISLDTEMAWGYTAHPSSDALQFMKDDLESCRGCIDYLLSTFKEYNIPATWAVVGHLFLDHCEREEGIPHRNMPRFKDDWYLDDPCANIRTNPLYYGRDILETILSDQIEHEIGYHSFSHVLFSDCTKNVADAEIREGIRIAKDFGIKFRSFVFPENKIGHVDVLKDYNFDIYRGVTLDRFSPKSPLLKRKVNGAIAKIIAPPTEPKWREGIWEIPGSLYFCDPQINSTLPLRANIGLFRAIRSKKVFHVFLHPHNLLMYPGLKKDFNKFISTVSKLRDERKIRICTMGDYADILNDSIN